MKIDAMGVLKAAGFYVPLSTSHPSVRNSYILRETAADLIVGALYTGGSAGSLSVLSLRQWRS